MVKNEFAEEMDLLNAIRLALQERQILSFRVNVGNVKLADGRWFSTRLPKGFSDILAILPGGKACFIETKQHPKKPTRDQVNFMLAMIGRGCPAGVAYTVQDAIDICEWEMGTCNTMIEKLRGYYD